MLDNIKKAILEIQQPRSRFQLEKFVVGQHPSKEMQYYQVCIELQDMMYKYEMAKLNVKKQNLKIARLRSTKDDLDELKAQELDLGLEQTKITMIGAEREIAHLVDIWSSFEKKFTRQEIEDAQPDYWKERFTINARAMLSSGSGINYAHLEAMEQAGVLEQFAKEIELEKKELGL
jgi:hypothetical protein